MANEKVLKMPKPLKYQADILKWVDNKDVKFISFNKSRQSGGSFLNKMLVTKWALENKDVKIGYITPTLKLSKLFYTELVKSLRPYVKSENKSDLIINFITGSYVQFFSAESGDSIRGFQHHYTILDECAFMNSDDIHYNIEPGWLYIGKKIIMCSTPNGNSGFFYENCQFGLNNEKGYRTKQINIYDNPLIDKETIERIKKMIPEKVFKQEYLGEFLDGSGSVFTNVKQCVKSDIEKRGRFHAGIDWGKQNDYTVVTILNEKSEMVFHKRINLIDYTKQVSIVASILNEYKPVVTFSEENNIGTVVNELLKKEYKGNVRCINLDNTLKKDIIENLVVAFEQMSIKILDLDYVIRELQSFTCKYNVNTQTVKYGAPNGLHDDCVISLAYAYHALKTMYKPRVRLVF